MGEIRIDNQRVTGATVDGQQVDEITIDGCVIRFEWEVLTGWMYAEQGDTVSIDLRDASWVEESRVRFKGAHHAVSNRSTSYSSASATPWVTGSTWGCASTSPPGMPSAPYGCTHSFLRYRVGVAGTQDCDNYDFYPFSSSLRAIFGGSPTGTSSVHFPCSPSMTSWHTWTGSSTPLEGCVRADTTVTRVRGAVRSRTEYRRTCYSADTNLTSPYFNAWYQFIAPEGDVTTWSHDIVFSPGEVNNIKAEEIYGSGRVYIQFYALVR